MGDTKKPEDYDPTGLGHLAKIDLEIANEEIVMATPPCRMPKGPDIDCGTAGLGLDVSQEGPPPSSRPLIQKRVPS
jgi:hypothetical protein